MGGKGEERKKVSVFVNGGNRIMRKDGYLLSCSDDSFVKILTADGERLFNKNSVLRIEINNR